MPEPAEGRISKDMELFKKMVDAYNAGTSKLEEEGTSEPAVEIKSEKTVKHLKVFCDGRFIAGVNVPIEADVAASMDLIKEDPLVQMALPDMDKKTYHLTWTE
jgi:hypothetical protein